MKKTLAAFSTSALLIASSSTLAAPVIYESFSQTPGTLNGVAGETGLGTWSVNQTVNVQSPATLSYGDLANAGGEAFNPGGSATDAWVTTTTALADNNLLDDGATLWFSYMYLKTSGGGSNEKGGFAFGTDRLDGAFNGQNMTNSGNGVGVVTNGASLFAASWSGGGNANNGGSLPIALSESTLIVVKVEWGATAGDDETITIYTPSTSDLGTLGTGAVRTVAGFDQTAFDTISYTERNSGGSQIFDEIRFGSTVEDVTPVPEPGSLALLGLGGLMMIKRRRRA